MQFYDWVTRELKISFVHDDKKKRERDIRKQADFMAFYVSKEDSWMMPEQCY